MTASEIARNTGIKYNTVYFHLNPDKCAKKKKKASAGAGTASVSTYAGRIMENEIRMELRKHSRRSREMHLEDPIEGTEGLKLKDMLADPRDCFELSEAVCELAERSGTLTERERTAVMIRIEYPEKSQAECGRMMGISQSLFSRRLIDARRKMAGA